MYQASRHDVFFVSNDDRRLAATTATSDAADRAATLLNRARVLNDQKRKYTAAARLIAEAETLDGFAWVE